MNSDLMMKCFMVAYFVCMLICLKERNFPRALYWGAAFLITLSVIWGMK